MTDCKRYDFTRTFDVLVGPDRKRISVHHDILTQRSGFFQAARKPQWIDGPQVPTDLSDYDPDDFQDYLQLVYTREMLAPDVEVSQWCEDGCHTETFTPGLVTKVQSHYSDLVNLYILADKLQDLKSANLIMDRILQFDDDVPKMPRVDLIRRIWTKTPSTSPLRAMVRDLIIYEAQADYFDNAKITDLPKELLLDIAEEHLSIKWEEVGARDGRVSEVYHKRISDFSKCHYHQHDDKHPVCK